MHRRFRAASYHVYMYTCKYFRSANMPTTFIHRVTRTARVSNDATFTGPDETYAAYRRSRDKSVHRQIRQTDTRIWPICRLEKLVSRPLVRRVLVLSFFIFFFLFFNLLMNHASRPRFGLLALITPARFETGLTEDGTLIRTVFAIVPRGLPKNQRALRGR